MIRRATHDDLEVLRELWEAFYLEWPEPAHRRKSWTDVVEHVRRHIDESVVLIADDDGAATGFALGWRQPHDERVGHLSDLYVRPEQRGLGRALVVEAAACLDREFVTLTTELRNEPARTFYAHLGFDEESVNLVIASELLA